MRTTKAGGDYYSAGVHANRDKTAKMKVKAYDRTGGPFKPAQPKQRTVSDAIQTAVQAGGGRNAVAKARGMIQGDVPSFQPTPREGPSAKQIGAALTKGAKDMAAQSAQADAEFNARHQQAVQEGSAMHQRMRQSTPGKAMSIIKNKRV